MSLSAEFQTSIVRDEATPEIERLITLAGPERSAKICRDPLRGFWRDHLKNYPRLPGKFFAFPSTGFGEEAADSVEGFAQNGAVRLVASKQGLRLRYTGGTIRAVNKKVLCFAVTEEAYGRTPYEFGLGFASRKDPELRARLRANFAFAKQVTFSPNPEVVPASEEFAEVSWGALVRSLAE